MANIKIDPAVIALDLRPVCWCDPNDPNDTMWCGDNDCPRKPDWDHDDIRNYIMVMVPLSEGVVLYDMYGPYDHWTERDEAALVWRRYWPETVLFRVNYDGPGLRRWRAEASPNNPRQLHEYLSAEGFEQAQWAQADAAMGDPYP